MPAVLLAEDEALVALSLGDFLEAAGWEVTLAFDGLQALEQAGAMAAEGRSPRLLITDLNMPHMRGEDLIRALRAEQPGLPVLVITGTPPFGGAEALQRYGGGHGPLSLVLKPVDYTTLITAVDQTVMAHRWVGTATL